ncbi:MAG: N-acetylmuramoyl-L-alanine amidase, partial [Microthrixaceae bacterium]
VVTIDPGHNGGNGAHPREINALVDVGNRRKECDTTGTSTNAGYAEATYTWDLAQLVQQVLQERGAKVVLTRNDNTGWGPCITQRAAIGNVARSDAAVSLHADGGPAGGRGFHVILPKAVPGLNEAIVAPSDRLGRDLAAAYAAGTGMPPADYIGSGGLDRRDDLGGLNLSTVPKVFIETGNMRNATDAGLLVDPAFRQRAGVAIADGITRYLTSG